MSPDITYVAALVEKQLLRTFVGHCVGRVKKCLIVYRG